MPKADYIRSMFNDISDKYDLLNDLLSFGTHRLWKRKLVSIVQESQPKVLLDCATGTGDIAFVLEEKTQGKITGIDFSPLMIEEAKKRSLKQHSKVHFEVADVQKLPFDTKSFDAATISFGIRNVEDLRAGLKELSRVSKKLFILEFGQPKNLLYRKFYFLVLRLYVPIFSLLTKRTDAYDYLITSSEQFPSAEKFVEIMKESTNYSQISYRSVFGGIAYIYQGKD